MITLLTSFNVLDQLTVEVQFTKNPYGFLATDLFEVGARVNPKRSFLFVSKLIGKHLDVHPDIPKATGILLADLLIQDLEKINHNVFNTTSLVNFVKTGKKDKPVEEALHDKFLLRKEDKTLFIGFAETATGLGHAVYSAFQNASFIHTTREDLKLKSVFDFEEEHSHAVDHRCYLMNENIIKDAQHVVLIDDEMTTGRTSLNLIRSLHQIYPKKYYTILVLLDWRNKEEKKAYQELEKELNTKISVVSLTEGEMHLTKDSTFTYKEEKPVNSIGEYRTIHNSMVPKVQVQKSNKTDYVHYPLYTGRFGLTSDMHDEIEDSAKQLGESLSELRKGAKTLVLGMGELMYLPSRIASYMGEGVAHKTTSRSPIYPYKQNGYPIQDRLSFQDDDGVMYYAYNLEDSKHDEIMVISEKTMSSRLRDDITSRFTKKGISEITFVIL